MRVLQSGIRAIAALMAGGVLLAGCSGDDEPEAAPTVVDRTTSADDGEDSPETDGENNTAPDRATPTYQNAPDVIVDENGRRSFPTQTAEQSLDMNWEFYISSLDEDEIPPRPDVEINIVDDPEEATAGYVACMHNAGWTDVQATEGGIESGEVPPGQWASWGLANYTCEAQNMHRPVAPMDEDAIERLYDHQVDYVIPCLEDMGHPVLGFPSKETFVDRYFAERSYTLATAMAGLSDADRIRMGTDDPDVQCHAFPEGLWN